MPMSLKYIRWWLRSKLGLHKDMKPHRGFTRTVPTTRSSTRQSIRGTYDPR